MNRSIDFPTLQADLANRLAEIALSAIQREYPNAPGVIMNGPGDALGPRNLHPAFYGCFDWHSSVHTHWMLVHLLRSCPELEQNERIRQVLAEQLTQANLQAEADYFKAPNRHSFERTYGWAWLLKLADELASWTDLQAQEWSANLEPLVETIKNGYLEFLPKQTYPIRVGTHANTAFGLAFALDYARANKHNDLEHLIVQRSLDYFANDRNYPATWEPAGNDFFSPALAEADLMTRIFHDEAFIHWFDEFLPEFPENLLYPPFVHDRADLQLVHLDGLSLSRAWCMKKIASRLTGSHPKKELLLNSAARHAHEGLAHVSSGYYGGEHWLASFAVYMLANHQVRSG